MTSEPWLLSAANPFYSCLPCAPTKATKLNLGVHEAEIASQLTKRSIASDICIGEFTPWSPLPGTPSPTVDAMSSLPQNTA